MWNHGKWTDGCQEELRYKIDREYGGSWSAYLDDMAEKAERRMREKKEKEKNDEQQAKEV